MLRSNLHSGGDLLTLSLLSRFVECSYDRVTAILRRCSRDGMCLICFRIFLWAVALALSAPTARPSPLLAGDILRIQFTTDPIANPCPSGVCDALWLFFSAPTGGTVGSPVTLTSQLFDGSNLLGAYSVDNCFCGAD